MPLSWRRSAYEWVAISLLLSACTVGVILFGAVRNWSVGLLLVLVYGGILLYLLRPFLNRELMQLRIPPGGFILLAMLIYSALYIPFASVPYEARIQVLKGASYVGAYFAWTELAARYGRWRVLLFIPLLVGTLVALYALVQHAQGSNMVLNMPRHDQYGMRASGTFRAPALFGAYLGTMICLSLSLMLMPAAGAFIRILSGYGLALFLPSLFLSQSRSGWVGAALGVPVVLLMVTWRKNIRWFLITLVALPVMAGALFSVLWFASPMFQERVGTAVSMEGSAGWRIDTWQDTIEMIKAQPLFGYGPGSFRWMFAPYQTWKQNMWVDFAHNDYLQLWAEYGLVGVLLMAAFIGTLLFRCLTLFRKAEMSRDAYLVAGFTGALIAALGHALFDFNFHIFSLMHLLVFFGGVTMSGLFRSDALRVRTLRLPVWGAVGGVLSVVTVCALLMSFQVGASGALLRLAEAESTEIDLTDMSLQRAAETKIRRAARIDPANWMPYLKLANIQRSEAFWIRIPDYKREIAETALDNYYKAYERNPYDMDVAYGLGRSWYLLGDEEKSLAYLYEAVDHVPSKVFYAHQLGLQLREMGRLEEALRVLTAARPYAGGDQGLDALIRRVKADLAER